MKKLLIILLLLSVRAFAGSETIETNTATHVGAGWDSTGCVSGIGACLADDSDPSQIYMYDNNNVGSKVTCSLNNTTTSSDSSIVSVTHYLRWKADNVGVQLAIGDSVDGQSSAMRIDSAFTMLASETWQWDSLTWDNNPDGSAWSWSDLDALNLAVVDFAHANNKWGYATEIETVIEYEVPSAGGGAWQGELIIIGGN